MAQSVGIKDVARAAGVSVGTVSNVINRPDTVAGETRARVLAAIDRLGYVRSESARQLRAGRSRIMGLLVGYLETEDFEAARAGMEATEVNGRWQAEMGPLFETLDGSRPDEAMKPLTEVFHLA